MATVSDSIVGGFKDVFLAGVGALALGAEKSKDLVDQLIAKGEITVEQGKELNEELKHKAATAATDAHEDLIAAHMASMTPEQRKAFADKVAEMAAAEDFDAVYTGKARIDQLHVVEEVERTEK